MLCPSCGYDNMEGADRCEECLTPLFNRGLPTVESEGLARSVMEDDLSQLEQEFLGVDLTASAGDVIRQMKEARVGCALVMDQGKLVGIFTERDLLNKLTGDEASDQTTPVSDLMSPNPEFLRETDSVATAVNKMSMGRYRHLPIYKADGTYAVTSIKHVLKYIAREEW